MNEYFSGNYDVSSIKDRELALLKNHQILITCFSCPSFSDLEKRAFRFYWYSLKDSFLYNPMIEGDFGKRTIPLYDDYWEGLLSLVESAEEYVKAKTKNNG